MKLSRNFAAFIDDAEICGGAGDVEVEAVDVDAEDADAAEAIDDEAVSGNVEEWVEVECACKGAWWGRDGERGGVV